MRTTALPIPGIVTGAYPERRTDERRRSADVPFMQRLRSRLEGDQRIHQRLLANVHAYDKQLPALSELALMARIKEVRKRLAASGFTLEASAEAFAVVREASRRQLGLAHFDTQLIAGHIMLSNRLAEMATGEGKTLTAALTAATVAMAGMPVHVITANDYLVARDAELLRPVYAALGLSVGFVTQPMDQARRRAAYACDITYCTAKEIVFDYLRDRMVRRNISSELHERVRRLDTGGDAPSALLLRGLWMALIDEADSILIDEARTPLVLSQSRINVQQQRYFREALAIAAKLDPATDFQVSMVDSQARLSERGRAKVDAQAESIGGSWLDSRLREELVTMAICARFLYQRDRHYIVRDGKVIMIDQTTGRVAPGRMWSRGLHQLIEEKEGCPPSGEQETIAQITYQRFFPRYLRVGGMSGTMLEAKTEIASV
jgi:preprotein translocase subunit SecA